MIPKAKCAICGREIGWAAPIDHPDARGFWYHFDPIGFNEAHYAEPRKKKWYEPRSRSSED